jgi:hypothetical protein
LSHITRRNNKHSTGENTWRESRCEL